MLGILLEMEKRLAWSGILLRAWSQFSPPPDIVFSGSLICYEFLSPLTPLKVFSWRSWQIESDRQTGSSVRPQESHSSELSVHPSITAGVLWWPGCRWLQGQSVHLDPSQSYRRPLTEATSHRKRVPHTPQTEAGLCGVYLEHWYLLLSAAGIPGFRAVHNLLHSEGASFPLPVSGWHLLPYKRGQRCYSDGRWKNGNEAPDVFTLRESRNNYISCKVK